MLDIFIYCNYTLTQILIQLPWSYLHLFTNRVENSVYLDQLAYEKPADLDLHCFQTKIYLGLGLLAWNQRVKLAVSIFLITKLFFYLQGTRVPPEEMSNNQSHTQMYINAVNIST